MTPRQESIAGGGELVSRLYELFDQFNRDYFSGQLDTPYISISRDLSPDRMGQCAIDRRDGIPRNHITVSRGLLGCDGDLTFVSDVMRHELVHAAINQRAGFPRKHGGEQFHRGAFARECNRIGAFMGLRKVKSHRLYRRSKRGLSARHWPMVCRDEKYRRELDRLARQDIERRAADQAKQVQEVRDNGAADAFRKVFNFLYDNGADKEFVGAWSYCERIAREAGTVRLNYLTGGEG